MFGDRTKCPGTACPQQKLTKIRITVRVEVMVRVRAAACTLAMGSGIRIIVSIRFGIELSL